VLYPAKALDPIKPALILPEVIDQSKWWEGKHHYMDPEGSHIFVFLGSDDMPNLFYNKNLVDPREFKSYWDMVNAKWRGKILVPNQTRLVCFHTQTWTRQPKPEQPCYSTAPSFCSSSCP
jgi:hypothetical protein